MTKRRLAVVLFGIAMIPLIYSGALIWANHDPIHNLDHVPAAIVNQDRSATSGDTTVDLGDELVDTLTTDDSGSNFDWVELDADAANDRLASGDVLVVLTVPSNFSANALSVAGDDPTAAKLTIRTNDAANQIVGNIASTIGTKVSAALSSSVSSTYLDNVYLGFTDIHTQIQDAATGAQTLASGTADAATGSAQLVGGINELASGASQLSSGAASLQSGAEQSAAGGAAVAAGTSALATASGSALGGAQTINAGESQLAAATSDLAAGSAGVSAGLQQLQASYAVMTDEQRLAAIDQLVAGSSRVQAGADAIQSNTAALAAAAGSLVGDAASGTGLATLQAKAQELSSGAASLSTGLGNLSSGAATLASGASTLASGASEAATGATALDTGVRQLKDGATTLADGLSSGAASIPSYTNSEAQRLSEVAADPIELEAIRANEVPNTGYSLAPYFMTLALWVGALAFYLMFPALRQKLIDQKRPSWVIALRSYLPGAGMALAQSLLVVLVVRLGVGIEPVSFGGLAALVALTSLTFVAINQALIALMGPIGRFVALVLIVFQLASAGATYPIQTTPGLFQVIHSWLPFTYSVEAFRSLIAGGSIGIGQAVLVLGIWLVVALVVTTLASRRARAASLVLNPAPRLLEVQS